MATYKQRLVDGASNIIYPYTHVTCVIDDNGKTINQLVTEATGNISGYAQLANSNNFTGTTNSFVNISASGTITGTKVYNAVWNDYAEWFERSDLIEKLEPGDILIWDGRGATKSNQLFDKRIIGVYSDNYGHIIGGEELDNMEENIKKFVPVGLKGRVATKIIGECHIGDLIVASEIAGVGIVNNDAKPNEILGKCLEEKTSDEIKRVVVLV